MTKLKNIQDKSIRECVQLLQEANKLIKKPIADMTEADNQRINDIHEIVEYNAERLGEMISPSHSHLPEIIAGQIQRMERIAIMRNNKDWLKFPRDRIIVRSYSWYDEI